MYLLVPVFGYLCDRYTARPISIAAATLFGVGYIGAAVVYRSGTSSTSSGIDFSGNPVWGGGKSSLGFGWMLVAFTCIGMGTCSMYLTAVTTCAKNFGKGKYKGLVLAIPISAFGVSGMWQAQLGTHVLTRPVPAAVPVPAPVAVETELDAGKYFLFLGILLSVVGGIGTFALKVVDEDELIDEAVEDLEREGLITDSARRACSVSRPRDTEAAAGSSSTDAEYGTFSNAPNDEEEDEIHAEEERKKKTLLLNYETSLFLHDETMWLLAIGFLFVTGPSEAYINNVGTIIDTLIPTTGPLPSSSPGLASTHVSIIALTSTISRLLVGTISDLFAPTPTHPHPQQHGPAPNINRRISSSSSTTSVPIYTRTRTTFSRMYILFPCLFILFLGYLLLSIPILPTYPALLKFSTAVIGTGYGASFSLVPIIIAVVWGVENFGTNWGIIAMFPAAGAAFWGMVYSVVYDVASRKGDNEAGKCVGWECYGAWAVGSTVSVVVAIGFCGMAWWRWEKRGVVV